MKRFPLVSRLHMLYLTYMHIRGNKIPCRMHTSSVNSVLCYVIQRSCNIDFSSATTTATSYQDFRCTNTLLLALKLMRRILSSSYRPIRANPKVIQENRFPVTANLLIRNPCRKLHRVATCCALLSCRKTIILFSRMIMPFINGSSIYLAIFAEILIFLFRLMDEYNSVVVINFRVS